MCPLRLILIFLSATIAGIFVLRSLKSQPEFNENVVGEEVQQPKEQLPLSSKIRYVMSRGFWTCFDMASGKYLWRIVKATNNDKKNN